MSRFLITGGGGFIGSNLVEAVLRNGDSVRALDDFSTGRRENLRDVGEWSGGENRFELLTGDIRNGDTCAAAMEGVDYVLHQAAIPSVVRSVEDPLKTNAVNVGGTLNLLQAAREAEVRRFVFASSSSIYGESETLPKVESMPSAPISPYGLQKLAGESYCGLYHRLYGVPTIALRYFNVFGPRQDPSSEYSAVIPKFMAAIRQGGTPVIYGDGGQTRDFSHISNVVQANLKACEAGPEALGEMFNIACGDRISLNDLVATLGRLAGRDVQAEYADPRPGDIRDSLADVGKAERLLGFTVEIAVAEGLERLWEQM